MQASFPKGERVDTCPFSRFRKNSLSLFMFAAMWIAADVSKQVEAAARAVLPDRP
jgi:hypothetical protein